MKRTVILSLGVALAAAAAAAAPPTVGELLRSVPDGARAVVAVDSAALRDVPKVQEWLLRHQAWSNANQDLRQFLADAGLDPVRDVDAMVAAIVGERPMGGALALFAGRYDPTSLGGAIVKRGAAAFTLEGMPAYRLPSSHHGGTTSAVLALPSPDLLVAGDEATVQAALEPPHAMPQLVQKEVAAGHIDLRAPFWAVATIPADLRSRASQAGGGVGEGGDNSVRGVIIASGSVERVAVQAFLDDSLKISGVAVADTVENAELLRDAVKGAIAAARLHAQGQAPDLVNVLRDVQVRLSGTEVSITGSIPLAVLEKLNAEHAGTHHPGSNAPIH